MAVPSDKTYDAMKTLYATDLDGTLLNQQARLSTEAVSMINELKRKGVLFSFVTARTPATVEPIMKAALHDMPGVVMTGAALWNPATRLYERVSYHRPEDALLVLEICRAHGVVPFVYTLPEGSNGLVVYHEAPCLTVIEDTFVKDRTLNDLKRFYLHQKAPEGFENETVLFFAMGDPERIRLAAEAIRAATDCYASWYPDTYNPGISLLEVFTSGVSKAEGLIDLKERVGADRVVAFGDNLNDIPMLKAADVAVAVENAHPEVKAVADIIIGPNTTDSVPRYILDHHTF